MKKLTSICVVMMLTVASMFAAKPTVLTSPNGNIKVTVDGFKWSLEVGGIQMIAPSEVAMTLENGTVWGGTQKCQKTIPVKNAGFSQVTFQYKEFDLVFRVTNDGAAYRFVSKSKKAFNVAEEKATFNLAEDWNLWTAYVTQHTQTLESQLWNSFENRYTYDKVSSWNKERLAFMPLMVDAANGVKLCITETDLYDYPGMFLYNGEGATTLAGVYARYPKEIEQGGHNRLQGVVKSRENYIAKCTGARNFPWRIVAVSTSDKDILANNMVYDLARPAAPRSDFSWVRPGKVAWDWWNDWNITGVDFRAGINNETYKYYIDFASEHGIEYVILDEGWAVNLQADLMQVVPEIDLQMLTDYAASKNVGLILWAGYWAFDRDMENVCRHYSEMGIKGFKIDFMDRDDQIMVNFHERAAKTAAKYKLIVDFHGTYKPCGLDRAYPNVLNYEGVHGLEQMKWCTPDVDQVTYDVTVPFIRMFAGPMDYTQGAMRNGTKNNFRAIHSEGMSQGTRCRQLAEYVVFNSPLSMLCDSPTNYMTEKESIDYIATIPTVWDEVRPLDAKVGEYVAIAKRSGNTWYIGAMTDWNAREMTLDLSFLNGDWNVEIFADGVNADRNGTDYKKTTTTLPQDGKITIKMAPGGGFAAVLTRK